MSATGSMGTGICAIFLAFPGTQARSCTGRGATRALTSTLIYVADTAAYPTTEQHFTPLADLNEVM